MKKKKKRKQSPFPRGKSIPPGKAHATKKEYDRRQNIEEIINEEEQDD